MIITDLPSQTAAGRSLVDEINSKGAGKAYFLELDVTNEGNWEKVAAEIEKQFGGIHVLINNAGAAFMEETPDEMKFGPGSAWHKTLALNLDGVAMGTKYGIKLMRKLKTKDRKMVINVSSTAGLKGIIGSYAYGAAKGAVTIYTKSVAVWAARHGINCKWGSRTAPLDFQTNPAKLTCLVFVLARFTPVPSSPTSTKAWQSETPTFKSLPIGSQPRP